MPAFRRYGPVAKADARRGVDRRGLSARRQADAGLIPLLRSRPVRRERLSDPG